jgi:hypothetical protein
MIDAASRLRHVVQKTARAKEHAAALAQELQAFYATNPFKVAAQREPTSRRLKYVVASADAVPDRIPLVAGDAIQNLMSALDHLAYQLVCHDTQENPPNPNWIYFPVADDVAKYEAKKQGKMAGASAATFAVIDALKPYRGGNDLLWTLYRLNNIEKHRILLTVGAQASGIHLGQLMVNHLKGTFPPQAIAQFESMDVFLNPADKGFPLTAGFELYIGAVDEEPNPKQQFRFDVVLSEPGIIEGRSLLATINEFVTAAEEIVVALTPCLH